MTVPVYDKKKPQTIQTMFNSIANRYDFTNAILSLQLHKYWNRKLVKTLQDYSQGKCLVDLCCGTGDICFEFLKRSKSLQEVHLIDFSSEMLALAKIKAHTSLKNKPQLSFIEADAQHIPLPNEMADFVSMAYGIRNIHSPIKSIKETYRILKPGGSFGILELTQPSQPLLKKGHTFYLKRILPFLGKWITSNQEAYQYLCNSIHTFISPVNLEKLMIEAGFQETKKIALSGGIATIVIGKKV